MHILVAGRLAQEFRKPPLNQQLGRATVRQEMRDFATAFVDLQEGRERADYDPSRPFGERDAANLIDASEAAMTSFDQVTPDEKADVLALLLVSSRK